MAHHLTLSQPQKISVTYVLVCFILITSLVKNLLEISFFKQQNLIKKEILKKNYKDFFLILSRIYLICTIYSNFRKSLILLQDNRVIFHISEVIFIIEPYALNSFNFIFINFGLYFYNIIINPILITLIFLFPSFELHLVNLLKFILFSIKKIIFIIKFQRLQLLLKLVSLGLNINYLWYIALTIAEAISLVIEISLKIFSLFTVLPFSKIISISFKSISTHFKNKLKFFNLSTMLHSIRSFALTWFDSFKKEKTILRKFLYTILSLLICCTYAISLLISYRFIKKQFIILLNR